MVINSKSKRVFITGGTGSVGQALVKMFSVSGCDVTFQYHTHTKIAAQLKENYKADPICMDFTGNFQLPEKHFDIVVNNAGINLTNKLTHEISMENWNHTLLVNTTIPFQIIRLYLPKMIRQGWGRIINISSIYGLNGVENNLPYTVSKHGLSGLTKTVAKEYAKHGITSNEICPGPVESKMLTRIGKEKIKTEGVTLDDYFTEICEEIPSGRLALPEEIAALAIFLTSPKADYINGVSLPLDGGLIA